MRATSTETSPKGVSEKQLETALRKNGGSQAAAARVLKLDRSAVWQRVAGSAILQRAMKEGKDQLIDMAEDNVMRAIHDGDMVTTRWFLERKGRDRGYGDVTPIDPEVEARRRAVVAAMMDIIEDRARAGLPPLCLKP